MPTKSINLIPGKLIAEIKKDTLTKKITLLKNKPNLKIIQIGNNSASSLYVSLKIKAAQKLGMTAQAIQLNEYNLEQISKKIEEFNDDPNIDGIMIQSPIPNLNLIKSLEIFNQISPKKDVDGLTSNSLGKLWQLKEFAEIPSGNFFISATPLGVLDCLVYLAYARKKQERDLRELIAESLNLEFKLKAELLTNYLTGKTALIINRSNIIGKPLMALLELANATVTLAHSHSKNLKSDVNSYDFVFTATGIDHFLGLENFTNNQIIFDLGINNNNAEQLVKGDVYFDPMKNYPLSEFSLAAVPGGVGPLTVINLLENVYTARLKNDLEK